MQTEQLKSLIASGAYRPQPALVAEAMLERRGVRTLLTENAARPYDGAPSEKRGGPSINPAAGAPINPVGQTPPAPEAGFQAA
jgi:hypothetical protein